MYIIICQITAFWVIPYDTKNVMDTYVSLLLSAPTFNAKSGEPGDKARGEAAASIFNWYSRIALLLG